MNKFESGAPILKKKLEERRETDLVPEKEERQFEYSAEEAEEILADLDKILAGVNLDFSGKTEKAEEKKVEPSADEIIADLDKILVEVDRKLIEEEKKRMAISEYGRKLEAGELGKQYYSEGWRDYWAERLSQNIERVPANMQRIVQKMKEGKPFRKNQSQRFQKYISALLEGRVVKEAPQKLEKSKKAAETKKERKEKRLYELGLVKKGIMFRLKSELRGIDTRKDSSSEELKDRRGVFYDQQRQSFFVIDAAGVKREISFGDLVGDYAWGIKYALDKSMPDKIWRRARKTLSLFEARSEIEKTFNEELRILGVSAGSTNIDAKLLESHTQDQGMAGVVAERMIVEFLTRVQYNNPDLGVRVEKSNAAEDTELKYDFKLVFKKRRGIALESDDLPREKFVNEKRRIGIQFTVSLAEKLLGKKTAAIQEAKKKIDLWQGLVKKKVEEIVLVSIPVLKSFSKLYQQWLQEGKPSGGPEQYLSRKQKLEIFKQATKGLLDLSEEELQKLKI